MNKLGAIAYKIVAALGVLALLIFCAVASSFSVGFVIKMIEVFGSGKALDVTLSQIVTFGIGSAFIGTLFFFPSLVALGWPLSLWCRGRALRNWLAAALGTVIATIPFFAFIVFPDKTDAFLLFLVLSLIGAALTGVLMWLALGRSQSRKSSQRR